MMKVARLISERLALISEDIRTLEGYRHRDKREKFTALVPAIMEAIPD